MSQRQRSHDCPQTTKFEIEDTIDAFCIDGGLSLDEIKTVVSLPLDKRDVSWGFWLNSGFSAQFCTYWIEENNCIRQYLRLEVALIKIECDSKNELLELALSRNRNFSLPLKFALSGDLLIFTLRAAVDGLTEEYLKDLISSLPGFCSTLHKEIEDRFQIPPLMCSLSIKRQTNAH